MSPIPAPVAATPYDNLESVLNVARTRLNDAIQSLSGDILTDSQEFTGTMTNSAWRKLQAFIANLGFSRYKRKFFGFALPVTATYDPSQPNLWNWAYYFDGTSYWNNESTPATSVLPADLICPLYLRERQTGTNAAFTRMRFRPDGLLETNKMPFNGQWEWKDDSIYIPGSTVSMDFEVEYAAFDADFVTTNNILGNPATSPPTTPSNMVVPIMRCQSAFANYLVAELMEGRDDAAAAAQAALYEAKAEKDVKLMMNNDVKLKQRTPVQRRSYAGRGRRGAWGFQGY
jgi:hypothetical protein